MLKPSIPGANVAENTPGRLLKRKWLLLGGLGVLIVIGVIAASKFSGSHDEAPKKSPASTEPEAVVVTVDPVTARPIRRAVTAVGSLWGWEEVPITPKVEGPVIRVHRFVGDVVKPGDVLLEIDPTDYQLAVNEAERSLELELARLNLTVPPAADFDIMKLPGIVRAEAIEKQARAKAARLRSSPRSAVSEEELQQADTDVEVARANVRQAELEARTTIASVRQRQAAVKSAQQRLAYTKIVVPEPNPVTDPGVPQATEYVISLRKVAVGETVRIIPFADAPPLFRLVIDRPLKLQLTLPERHLDEVQVGQTVELEVEAYPGERFTGTVSRVNRSVDRSNHTFMAEVVVPNADRRLSAGSFVKATIITRLDDQARTVPEESLVQFAGITKLFVLEGDRVREVKVKLKATEPIVVAEGSRKRTWVEVDGDLPVGASVVTSGQSRLAAGLAARVRR